MLLIPNFLIALIAANTSSDFNKLCAVDTPLANDENKTHLILILLSPLTVMHLLNFLIFFFIIIAFEINLKFNLI